MTKTAIVILNWNGMKFLKLFLGTLVRFSSGSCSRVYIADNGSTDGSADWASSEFSSIELIKLDRNYGFAGGYNLALDQIEAEYYLLINSDVEVTEGWLDPLVTYMDRNPDTAACQPKILSWQLRDHFEHAGAAGGYIDRYGFPLCRGRIFDCTEKDEGQYDSQADIFWSSGACMIVRSEIWKRCGGFDPSFFAHMEEIDLCWRMHRAGYSIRFIPGSVVYHVGGGSLSYDSPFKVYLNFRNSLFMLYRNLPRERLYSTLFIRKLFDGLAAAKFLVTLNFGSFGAVFKAHMSYYKNLKELRTKREALQTDRDLTETGLILNKSIVFEFYLRGRKKFSSL